MAKFCRHCGSPVTEGAKFCKNCGQLLEAASGQPEPAPTEPVRQRPMSRPAMYEQSRPAEQPARGASFCRFCENPIQPGAKFCNKCGNALEEPDTRRTSQPHTQASASKPAAARKAAATPEAETSVSEIPQKTKKTAATKTRSRRASAKSVPDSLIPQVQSLTAAATAGEIEFGVMNLPELSGITEVLTPIAGIFQSIGSWISGIFRIFKNPASLIGTLALAALYVFLALNRNSDSEIIKWLSLLTYAEGGFDRGGLDGVQGILGTVGGTLGKGTTAAALLSLFNGGLVNVFKGIGTIFSGHGEKRSIISFLFGVLVGGTAYFAFVGRKPSAGSFVAGIAGALLSLEALGSGSGKLYALAQSLTSRAADGIRTAVQGKCNSLLRGLTLGFVLATVLSRFA